MERKSPSLKVWPPTVTCLACVIDVQRAGAADADLAHLAGDERRVRTDAAARGQNAFGGDHAAQIFRRGFHAHEQHFFALVGGFDGAVGVEINFAGGRAGAGGQTGGDDFGVFDVGRSKTGARSWSNWSAGTRSTAVFPVNQFFLHHLHANCERRPRRCACRCGSGA